MGKYGKHRPLVRLIALLLVLSSAAVQANCRQALSLGLDVSGSVDRHEYSLQLRGLANALISKDVKSAFLVLPGAPVRLHIFVWSGRGGQRTILDWTEIGSEEDLESAAQVLFDSYLWRFSAETSLGDAMLFGAAALATQSECWRMTLDISGDGKSNTGAEPRIVKKMEMLSAITVNALVVGTDRYHGTDRRAERLEELALYFQSYVIQGPEAFVQIATSFDSFETAMEKKLLKELQTMVVGENSVGWE